MITGRSGGSGKYSYVERSSHNKSCQVAHMPEDYYNFRIKFSHDGDPIDGLKLGDDFAQLLWAALNETARIHGWKDFE